MSGYLPVQDALTSELGYPVVLARIAMTSRAAVPCLNLGNQFLGLIPRSLKVCQGWVCFSLGTSAPEHVIKLTQCHLTWIGTHHVTHPV